MGSPDKRDFKDYKLRSPGGLILTHTQYIYIYILKGAVVELPGRKNQDPPKTNKHLVCKLGKVVICDVLVIC